MHKARPFLYTRSIIDITRCYGDVFFLGKGTFSNDDDDGKEKVRKRQTGSAFGLVSFRSFGKQQPEMTKFKVLWGTMMISFPLSF